MAVAMDAPNEKMTTMKSTMLYLKKIIRKINKKEKNKKKNVVPRLPAEEQLWC